MSRVSAARWPSFLARGRDSAIGAILAFGMGIGVLLLGFYQGFATAATNILFGNIFGLSGSQLLILVVINLLVAPCDGHLVPAAAVRLRRPGGC